MAPACKEWAAVVHALLEGEQILDVRKGGLREDGRHFSVQSTRLLALPDRRAPEGRAAEGAVPPLDRSRARGAGRRADHDRGLGRRREARDRHRGRAARRHRVEADLDRRLRRVALRLEEARPALGAGAAGAPARRAGHGAWDATATAAARRGWSSPGCPTTPRRSRATPRSPTSRSRRALKGAVEALPTLAAPT